MNSNTFQDNAATTADGEISYKFGSLAHSSPDVRKRAVEHNVYCIELGQQLGSTALTVWLADGINHPGQADFRRQFERVADGLREIHEALPDGWKMFTEHKPYEPAFYSSVNADWGSSLCSPSTPESAPPASSTSATTCPNTNIEQVVSRLAMVGRLGGFHFNDSKYGDDDLTVGSIHPYQFFLIVVELFKHGGGRMPDVAYMIDASHNLKDPLEDMVQATDQIQVTVAQAALARLRRPRRRPRTTTIRRSPPRCCRRAYRSDVRPIVAEARRRNGAAIAPLLALRRLGYRRAMVDERGSTTLATGL